MKASEFIRETTDAKEPPMRGSKEYNASKASFLTYIQRFVATFNNNIAALEKNTGNELDYKTVYADFLKKFQEELKKRGGNFIIDRDFDNIFKNLPTPEELLNISANQSSPSATQGMQVKASDGKTYQLSIGKAGDHIWLDSKTGSEAPENIDAELNKKVPQSESIHEATDTNYIQLGSAGSISRVGNGAPQIILKPQIVDGIATALTDSFYNNRKLAATNKTVWQQLKGKEELGSEKSGGDSVQNLISRLMGVDPRNPNFGQVLSNVLSSKEKSSKLAAELNRYLPPQKKAEKEAE